MRGLIIVVIIVAALAYAYSLRWIAEDAYISFRYAQNLADGKGLVFNQGERVEGYTNFLWTILLTAGLKAGLRPESISVTLGLFCTVISFLSLFGIYRNLFGKSFLFPASLLALALNYTWACFSTSGMETCLLSALIVSSFYVLSESELSDRREDWKCFVLGVLLVLALMTRPDAILACAVIFLFLAFRVYHSRDFKPLVLFIIPFVIIYLPYFFWRYRYYGHLLPNTFYAKSAYEAYYKQGFTYLWEFAQRYSLWLLAPLILAAILKWKKINFPRGHLILAMAVFCVVHIAYVVWVGGDFMEGRFFVPILPFLYLICEYLIRVLLNRPLIVGLALMCLPLTSVVDRPIIEARRIQNGIADERTWLPVVQLWYLEGQVFGKQLPQNALIATDAVGAFGYASRLPILDTLGLTDEIVAHNTLKARSRPGHEKFASLEYLKERRVAIIRDGMGLYKLERQPDWILANNRYYLITEDPQTVQSFWQAVSELSELLQVKGK
jgi:arabinofuranosyltransferase